MQSTRRSGSREHGLIGELARKALVATLVLGCVLYGPSPAAWAAGDEEIVPAVQDEQPVEGSDETVTDGTESNDNEPPVVDTSGDMTNPDVIVDEGVPEDDALQVDETEDDSSDELPPIEEVDTEDEQEMAFGAPEEEEDPEGALDESDIDIEQYAATRDNTYIIPASGDKTGKTDGDVYNRISALCKKKATTIIFEPGKTYYFKSALNVWNNWTIIGDGATINMVTPNYCLFLFGENVRNVGKTITNDKLGGYERCKNITIDGGTYIGKSAVRNKNGSFMQFMHGQNITIKNCTIQKDGGGHHLEFAGVKNSTISNVRFRGNYDSNDQSNEVIQLDATGTEKNAPAGAPWDNTPCANITITNCDINVANQPVGIGTSNGKSGGAIKSCTHSSIKITNNLIYAVTSTVVFKPTVKSCLIKNNRLYKGGISSMYGGGYTASGNKTFKSRPAAPEQIKLSASTAVVNPTECVYTGSALMPPVSLKSNGKVLRNGNDVTLTYSNNVNKGRATVKVVGKGAAYTGVATLSFTIVKYSNANISRLAGSNALGTMQSIVQRGWSANDQGTPVIVATRASYKDALSAAGLAGTLGRGAPILLTDGKKLSDQTRAELVRLKPSLVYIAGGTSAVSASVESAINSATGVKAKRLAGSNSIDTANKIALAGKGNWSDMAILATNASYKDALSAAPVAYALNMPIFLTNGKVLASGTASAMQECGIKHVVVVGGTKAVPAAVYNAAVSATGTGERIAGSNAINTSAAIAMWGIGHSMDDSSIGVATAGGYADALCGAALCGRREAVLVLSTSANTSAIASVGKRIAPNATDAYIFGGTAAVSMGEETKLDRALAGM